MCLKRGAIHKGEGHREGDAQNEHRLLWHRPNMRCAVTSHGTFGRPEAV